MTFAVDAYHTASATVEHGSEEGVWISLTGENTPVVVRCDSSDVITQYYVNYLDENNEIKVKVCKLGRWYYFPTLRNSTYQVQARVAYYITEDGITVGGDVVIQYADASDQKHMPLKRNAVPIASERSCRRKRKRRAVQAEFPAF